ncbi:hypothetical protein KEM52_003870, partial [Ascosphaera acerosa]
VSLSAAQVMEFMQYMNQQMADLANQFQSARQEQHNELHAALSRQGDKIRSEVQTALQEHQSSVQGEINELRTELKSVRRFAKAQSSASCPAPAAATVAVAPTSSSPDLSVRVVKIPNPEVFTGTRNGLSRWLAQVRVKLSVNASQFPNKEAQIGYLFSCLSGSAAQQLLPYFASASGSSSLSSSRSWRTPLVTLTARLRPRTSWKRSTSVTASLQSTSPSSSA